MMGDEDRLARAALTYIAEPADPFLGRLLDQVGPVSALRVVRSGTIPNGIAGDRKEHDQLTDRIKRWQVRLPTADPTGGLATCAEFGGRLLCPGDAEWPTQLDALGGKRPYALWIRGDHDLRYGCLRSVAIVGARAATPYGVQVAAEMALNLTERQWTVISGGAFGIDAAAHKGALAATGPTIAVLASGIDVPYPRGNQGLFCEIIGRGLLVSEWPPGRTPTRYRFLVRNRVIAALTRGTVVVEAGRRSGATNTAGHAADLGRHLMVVPGPVTSQMSVGCHELLRAGGATCVTDASDVLEQVGAIGADLAPLRRGPVLARDSLDPTTTAVLEALPVRGGAGPATVAVAAGVEVDTVLRCLGRLAAAGFAERNAGGWRARRDRGDASGETRSSPESRRHL
jgi:DNA processing protein